MLNIKKTTPTNWIILLTILLILFYLVILKDSKEATNKSNTDKKEFSFLDIDLEDEEEKIALLSIIKNTQKDTLTFILKQYLFNVENELYPYDKAINDIAEKYKISKHKIASIIFSYKYEALTKEDVINEFTDNENEINYRQSTSEPDGFNDRY